jgi:hypothetical protein
MGSLYVTKKLFVKIAQDNQEYEKDASTTDDFIKQLVEQGVDIYTFLERTWCCPIKNPQSNWIRTDDNVGMLEVTTLDAWFTAVGKKTRNMIRKAEKSGVKVTAVEPNPKLVEGIWKIYNETPVRQGRAFSHYGQSLQSVNYNLTLAKKSTFIGAYIQEELVGFIQIIYGDHIAVISQILSLQQHWDKSLNNALLAKAVEVCAGNGNHWLMYGRIGNHPSLDKFKESNGFVKYPIARYYVPLSGKGSLAIRLGLHKPFKDALPESFRGPLIPIFNWVSRNKVLLKLRLKKRQVQAYQRG